MLKTLTAKELMTADPACCREDTTVIEVAQQMCESDCGVIPVLDASGKPVGMVTDRDIACRVVAKGLNAREALARDCMTAAPVTVALDADVDACLRLLEEHQLRRLAVVDESGACCGVIAQADIARHGSKGQTAELVKKVSKPRGRAERAAPPPMF